MAETTRTSSGNLRIGQLPRFQTSSMCAVDLVQILARFRLLRISGTFQVESTGEQFAGAVVV